jgi:hypothetical protein
MNEHRTVWLIAACALFALGVYLIVDSEIVFGAIMAVGGVLCLFAGMTGRDYAGNKTGTPGTK